MTDDWKRLDELERISGTLQYGQTLQVSPGSASPDLAQASKDLIRFVGKKTDINALRVYLGPWQTAPNIALDPLAAVALYANPTPWAPPEPRTFDSFTPLPCYARIMWGAGGVQHTAYVDWPKRGGLLQVSGSYLQVNAFVDTTVAGLDATQLPLLGATLGPEPGGGDSLVPATFTYPMRLPLGLVGAVRHTNYQIPPFARAFLPLCDWVNLASSASSIDIAVQERPFVNGTAGNDIQRFGTPTGGVYDQTLGINPIPIAGQQGGTVRIEIPAAGAPRFIGCMFLLEL